jgi:hypothetical protein
MNADILRRLVRAIAEGSQPDLELLATKVVDGESAALATTNWRINSMQSYGRHALRATVMRQTAIPIVHSRSCLSVAGMGSYLPR